LTSIDPAKTIDITMKRADKALNSFDLTCIQVMNVSCLKNVLIKFFRHTENTILKIPNFSTTDTEMEWSRCYEFLEASYGEDALRHIYHIAKTGVDGGLYGVLKNQAKQMAYGYAKNEIKAKVRSVWNNLSVDEKLRFADSYIEKYKSILPPDLTESKGAVIKANFPKVMDKHPHMIKKFRNILR
jgi:hypothetical protein